MGLSDLKTRKIGNGLLPLLNLVALLDSDPLDLQTSNSGPILLPS